MNRIVPQRGAVTNGKMHAANVAMSPSCPGNEKRTPRIAPKSPSYLVPMAGLEPAQGLRPEKY